MGEEKRKEDVAGQKFPLPYEFTGPRVRVTRADRVGLLTLDGEALVLRQAAGIVAKLPEHPGTAGLLARLAMSRGEADVAERDTPVPWSARATKHLIGLAIQKAYPDAKNLRKRDRVIFKAWNDYLDFEDPEAREELTFGDLAWLLAALDKALGSDDGGSDDKGLEIWLSSWLVPVKEYSKDLYDRGLAAVSNAGAPLVDVPTEGAR
jgi:hypothetical protein